MENNSSFVECLINRIKKTGTTKGDTDEEKPIIGIAW